MKRHILVSDQDRPLLWIDSEDDRRWITLDDFKAMLGLIVVVGLFIAWCAVESPR